ncbi:TetR/AcrR family transcriptional regulator [Paenibacillus albiflavus]|uniref:TetR/AcrR family transcriptional regulator n=1 Tax=Paenibacillus albiflavus TaxID=2545760 RepID=UPI0014044604|nr:TetR/AcrR family transcriptional regulator [Paenibacillus albiflavus]
MQVLKDEIKELILKTAEQTFLEQGYEKASMKEISKQVQVSTGNLYRYFANKEALFDAVTLPAYQSLQYLIEAHDQNDDLSIPLGIGIVDQLAALLSELLVDNREGLLILIYGSEGTSRAGAKEELCQMFAAHIETHLITDHTSNQGSRAERSIFTSQIAKPIAVAFLEGYFEIIRLYTDRSQIHEATRQYITLWFMGLQSLA